MISRGLTNFSKPFDTLCSIQFSIKGVRAERAFWSKRNPKGLEYLDKIHGDSVHIRPLIYEYRDAVTAFGDWMLTREREINAQALRDYDRVESEIKTLSDRLTAEELDALRAIGRQASWFNKDVVNPAREQRE